MVISEMIISRKALNVPKIPCLPFSMPNPAAAAKLARSMMPELTKMSG